MKKILAIIFIFFYYQGWSQGNILTISGTAPAQFTVCGTPQVFNVSIFNPSPFLVTNDTLKLTMPSGISYQTGSITGASEINTSVPNQPVFLLSSMPTLSTLNITFSAAASCAVIQYIGNGGVIQNTMLVDYTANSSHNYDTYTLPYNVRQPSLSFTSVTNQSYSGNLGDIFTRCITITNSGSGALTQFTFTDIHGSGIHVNSINNGTWVNSGGTETVTFGAAIFNTVGNHNAVFEQGESVTLCETISVASCSLVSSDFSAFWGCNSQVCQSAVSAANVVFPNLIPNIQITPDSPPMNNCLGPGHASLQKLIITNTGLGQAVSIQLDIFLSNGNGYNNNMGSNIDETSFTMQAGSATPVSITPDSTESVSQLNCMPASAKGRVVVTIPVLNPGDTVYLRFNTYSCCYNACTGAGQSYFNGWAYKGTYTNACQSPYLIATAWGRVYSQLFGALTNNYSPTVLDSGQTGNFNFKFTGYVYQQPYPGDGTAYWKFVFTIPPCLTYAALSVVSSSGAGTWNPSSVNVSGSTVTAIFNGQPPFNLDQAQVKIALPVNCNGCAGDPGNVVLKVSYVPSTSCGCEATISCVSAPVIVLCSSTPSCPDRYFSCAAYDSLTLICFTSANFQPCTDSIKLSCHTLDSITACHYTNCVGMSFYSHDFKRTSYGLPDNEPGGGNGLPDTGGSLNFSKIKTNRAMFGDTITASYNGLVITNGPHPAWQYCYATSTMTNGNLLGFLDADLSVYRSGALLAHGTNFPPTITNSGTDRDFYYNLSAAALISSGAAPAGFTYLNSDVVIFKPRYKVNVNTTGPIFNCKAVDSLYVSDIMNPPAGPHKFLCTSGDTGKCFIMGYKFVSYDENYYFQNSCDTFSASQNYGLSIGPCCNNYDGGNLFPYEYRNWAHIDTLKSTLPPGFKFVSAQFSEKRTAGTGVSASSAVIPLTPLNPNSSALVFPVQSYFQAHGGAIPYSDDGFSGVLQITMEPSCASIPLVSQGITDDWIFTPTVFLTGAGSFSTSIIDHDYVVYQAPDLLLQSILPSVNAPDSNAVWYINISNSSNVSNAFNAWLSAPQITGVNITQVYDLDNSIVVPPSGAFYKLGEVSQAAVRKFRITGSFTSCNQDSIIIYSGWNCAGYPDSLAAYQCVPQKITLKETPLLPLLDLNITSPAGSVPLCDTTTYIVDGLNFQLGTLYNVLLSIDLPAGLSIVPGSSKLSYPLNSVYTAIPNPAFVNGTTWQWNLSVINNLIRVNGLGGILDTNMNEFKIKFKVVTNCDYTSGSIIHFTLKGNAACGFPVIKETAAPRFYITGALPPYSTEISLRTSYLSPCALPSLMRAVVQNKGPSAFGSSDSVIVQLPPGVSYTAGSFTGIHNAPAVSVPSQVTYGGSIYLGWKLPPGVAFGDSTVFTFNYQGNPSLLSCDISLFEGSTISSGPVTCTTSGSSCAIDVVTGDTTLSVYTYKAFLALSNGSAASIPNPPGGETVTVNLDITNTGEAIQSGASIIQFYYDANGNGVYNSGDVFLAQDTLLVTSNGSISYSHTFNAPAGQTCSIIAVVDTAVNPCVCNPSQLLIHSRLTGAWRDTTVCSGGTLTLNSPPVNGYTYSWTPAAGLNDTAIANPVFTAPILTNGQQSFNYFLTSNRIACSSSDTFSINVFPIPDAAAIASQSVCNGNAVLPITFSGTLPGTVFKWTNSDSTIGLASHGTGNIASFSAVNSGNTTINAVITVVPTANGCSGSSISFTITITTPNVNAVANQAVCSGDAVAAVNFSSGSAGATFSWTNTNSGIGLPASGSGDIASFTAVNNGIVPLIDTVAVIPTANGCSGAGIKFTITVNPAPTITAVANQTICHGDTTASVTLSSALPGASFTWVNSNPAIGLAASGTGNIASFTPINSTAGVLTAVITASASANGCSASAVFTIAAQPVSNVNVAVPADFTVCSGVTVPASNFISTPPGSVFNWVNSNTSIGIGAGGTGDVPAFTAVNSGTARVSASITVLPVFNGCPGISNTYTIAVNPLQPVSFTSGTAIGCPVLCITFANTSASSVFCSWSFGDGSSSNGCNLQHCYEVPGSHTVTLSVTDTNGCISSYSSAAYVTVYPKPAASFSMSPQPATILAPEISFTDLSVGAVTWNWTFGDLLRSTSILQNPEFTYLDTGYYCAKLKVSSQFNCVDSTTACIEIEDDFTFYAPNSFTLNDDGLNDGWTPKGVGIDETTYEMLIFDRWGNLIWSTTEWGKAWDGRANYGSDVAQMDVYVWKCKFKDRVKKLQHQYIGRVSIVK